jgi:hypothetical protein
VSPSEREAQSSMAPRASACTRTPGSGTVSARLPDSSVTSDACLRMPVTSARATRTGPTSPTVNTAALMPEEPALTVRIAGPNPGAGELGLSALVPDPGPAQPHFRGPPPKPLLVDEGTQR